MADPGTYNAGDTDQLFADLNQMMQQFSGASQNDTLDPSAYTQNNSGFVYSSNGTAGQRAHTSLLKRINPFGHAEPLDAIAPKDVPINFNALAEAYGTTESAQDYGAVGRPTGVKMGIAMGRFQYMSGRDDVRQIIGSKPGGADFLKEVDTISARHADKSNLSQAEKAEIKAGMDKYFTKQDQDQLFVRDQTHLYNVAVRQMHTTDEKTVVGRMFEMHYGGTGCTIHGDGRDVNGVYDIATYGNKGLGLYEGLKGAVPSNQVVTAFNGPQQTHAIAA